MTNATSHASPLLRRIRRRVVWRALSGRERWDVVIHYGFLVGDMVTFFPMILFLISLFNLEFAAVEAAAGVVPAPSSVSMGSYAATATAGLLWLAVVVLIRTRRALEYAVVRNETINVAVEVEMARVMSQRLNRALPVPTVASPRKRL